MVAPTDRTAPPSFRTREKQPMHTPLDTAPDPGATPIPPFAMPSTDQHTQQAVLQLTQQQQLPLQQQQQQLPLPPQPPPPPQQLPPLSAPL
ncbi:hypothetical protein JB92DRAFT_3144912 [Gautieria morchelliformis]|nr:hypothetical protein JB92DRAFT_3144912 [Gautieria morchelliformis]